jgi:hypothetical protein
MRAWAYDLIKEAVDPWTVLSSGAVGRDDAVPPSKPFVVIRAGVIQIPIRGGTKQTRLFVYVHDEPGTMIRIDDGHDRIKAAFDAVEVPSLADGSWLQDVIWESLSDDFYDDGFKTNTRFATYLMTGGR